MDRNARSELTTSNVCKSTHDSLSRSVIYIEHDRVSEDISFLIIHFYSLALRLLALLSPLSSYYPNERPKDHQSSGRINEVFTTTKSAGGKTRPTPAFLRKKRSWWLERFSRLVDYGA